jgi:hypothetical protein
MKRPIQSKKNKKKPQPIFVIYDDNNQSMTIKGVFNSYKRAFDNLPDFGHAIKEFRLNELDMGTDC